MSRAIYWFRSDLRLEDNEGFNRAVNGFDEVVPLYVLDKSWLEGSQLGIERMGVFRLKFLLESLQDLKEQLKAIGGDLHFIIGDTVEQIDQVRKQFNCDTLIAQKSAAWEEEEQERALSEIINSEFVWGDTLYHLNDLPYLLEELPDVFTAFRKSVEKKAEVRSLVEAPLHVNIAEGVGTDIPGLDEMGYSAPVQDDRAVIQFQGGSGPALNRLNYYLWDKELLANYKQTRNGLIGGDYSSKFSPWLAHGCISARQIYWQVKKFEKYVRKNSSTYWLVFELIWRDYFHFVAKKYGAKIFQREGILGEDKIEWGDDRLFHLWRDGKTGEPFVDANMHEMNATGFMSNRGRQNVASYLMHNMRIDWRLGAAYFEKMLIDYDPCSNYGNWIYIAGVGNDPRGGREFNIQRQKDMYDPKGEYQELWA
ncbi:DASH family cryptochrome [Roseivirga sp.]|uniref:DASH family cryptochrome n=1 Tax=Roseivirga sp. TaxID=1964215 RepID=UPI003B523D20